MYDNQFIGLFLITGGRSQLVTSLHLSKSKPSLCYSQTTLSCSAYEVNFGAHTLTSWLQLVSGIQEITHNVYTAMYSALCFPSECINAMALWDGRAVKEYQKPWFRPRPWGSITTGGSWQPSDLPFQKMTRIQALQAHAIFLAALKHRAFVWSITVDLLLFFVKVSTGSHPSLCSLFLLDRMQHFSLIFIQAECSCIYSFQSLGILPAVEA